MTRAPDNSSFVFSLLLHEIIMNKPLHAIHVYFILFYFIAGMGEAEESASSSLVSAMALAIS